MQTALVVGNCGNQWEMRLWTREGIKDMEKIIYLYLTE